MDQAGENLRDNPGPPLQGASARQSGNCEGAARPRSEGPTMIAVRYASQVNRFAAKLEPVPHGGLFVVVPAEVAAVAHLAHGARVRGTVNGIAYRSSLMKYSGVFHLGVHKSTALAANVTKGNRVKVTIEIDDEPLPTDAVPEDLARALFREPK